MRMDAQDAQSVAVVGSGISGLSAAWLLSHRHRVTLYEKSDRIGGHANTARIPGPVGDIAVDTGFIVYNPPNYPNLVALFDHLGVPTQESDMSFAVSLDDGAFNTPAAVSTACSPRGGISCGIVLEPARRSQALLSTAAADAAGHGICRLAPTWTRRVTVGRSRSSISFQWLLPSGRHRPKRCAPIRSPRSYASSRTMNS